MIYKESHYSFDEVPIHPPVLEILKQIASFAESNGAAAHLTMDADAWKAHARRVREVIAILVGKP